MEISMNNITAIRAQKEAAALNNAGRLACLYGRYEIAIIMQEEAAFYYEIARKLLSDGILAKKTSQSFDLAAQLMLAKDDNKNYKAFKKRAEKYNEKASKLLGN
jgi:hypothetical protein